MVKKGEFVAFAAGLDWDEQKVGDGYSTEMQIIIELAKKIVELEARIVVLEKEKAA